MALPDAQLASYQNLLKNARSILLAAREGRWDDLPALRDEREVCIAHAANTVVQSTVASEVEAKLELIQSILECDELTKALVNARKTELGEVLGSLGNERKLVDAYQSG